MTSGLSADAVSLMIPARRTSCCRRRARHVGRRRTLAGDLM